MEDFESPFDDFSTEGTSLEGPDTCSDCRPPEKKQVPLEGLSNVDYSLNSPLTCDEVDEFLLFLRGFPYRKGWNKKLWVSRRKLMEAFKIRPEEIQPTDSFHQRFFKFLQWGNRNTESISKILDMANKGHKSTWDIPQSFLLAWVGKDVPCPDKGKLSKSTLNYGALWFELHVVTLHLNASSRQERQNLCDRVGGVILGSGGEEGVKVCLPNFGVVYILKGFACFSRLQILADRNMVLMMKDVTNSRFQCLMSLQNRIDKRYDESSLTDLEEVYRLGDEMIINRGNKAYDGIKLVEPLCNLRLIELAQLERPRIPLFTDFRRHLEEKVRTGEDQGDRIEALFRKITSLTNVETLLLVYGSYRHWGHPFLEYLEGLRKLHTQTTMKKRIDKSYAKALASDLAYIVLKDQFSKTKKWAVDLSLVGRKHPLRDNFENNTWPTPFQIKDFGDHWDELPLIKCFEIPDVIDPSQIYSDKSHSITRKEIIHHLTTSPEKPIPSRKVLESFIRNPATDWKTFLQEINDFGLDSDSLVIGLRGKEREIKRVGRFFALMSWKLRDYFVVTEYLIKLHFVPLFSGLTMADDLNTVIKKMLDTSNGQGLDTYDYITLANHIDYEKWNNHQRGDANNPVFSVMGKFLGYPNLITRTHEFFEKSLIYYNNRPDLMAVVDGRVVNKDPDRIVCWEGQAGGLEGLRQKGWSIVNLLVIRREGKAENTRLSILAQGDNQVVCTQYKLQKVRTDDELDTCIQRLVSNNNRIMRNIEDGTKKLGLLINHDETMKSADYLVYGKVPIYRGRIRGLETKRWSRFGCVSNDQLPTLANVMTTVSSNALSVSHFSESPLNTIAHYNFLGNLTIQVLDIHNPAVRGDIRLKLSTDETRIYESSNWRILALYLDPSLGGICGISLTRFLIRAFPDPVTESLSFWRGIHDYLPARLRPLVKVVGSPALARYSRRAFSKLMENPLSLNLLHGVDPVQMITEEIKAQLIRDCDRIRNHVVRDAVRHSRDEEFPLYGFLESVSPRFPRFLSEYKSATYLGLTEALVGLFQNAKTIRNIFSDRMKRKIDEIIITSEARGVSHLARMVKRAVRGEGPLWQCSATQADSLRTRSWGTSVVGATVPHPFEMTRTPVKAQRCSQDYEIEDASRAHLSVLVPQGIPANGSKKGPYKPYLGSKTTENTSLLRPWENEIKLPLVKRAADLRKAFHWFVDPCSHLGRSIFNNLRALTGIDWEESGLQAHRTGSALHRFSCSRQSQGGYIAQSPLNGTWMIETTDSMSDLGGQNYDFLFQALLLYGQMTVGELHSGDPSSQLYHLHIQCRGCLREVDNITLDSAYVYDHPPVDHILGRWKPDGSEWVERRPRVELTLGDWDSLSDEEKSYHIGRSQGFLFGELIYHSERGRKDTTLFPLVLRDQLRPREYLDGLLFGIICSASVACLYKRSIQNLRRPLPLLYGQALFLIDQLSNNDGFVNTIRSDHFLSELMTIPHRIPPSYPLKNFDLGQLGRNYLRSVFTHARGDLINRPYSYSHLYVFGDCMDPDIIIPYVLSQDTVRLLYFNKVTKDSLQRIREIKNILGEDDPAVKSRVFEGILKVRKVFMTGSEVRHSARGMSSVPQLMGGEGLFPDRKWGREYSGEISIIKVPYSRDPIQPETLPVTPRIQCPLISGLRLFQCPTGAHYKLRSIIDQKRIDYLDFLVGGDGSGGMTSMLLRASPISRGVFNSLLDLDDVELKGSSPAPPSAISCIPEVRDRCINYQDVWKHPSDLCRRETWQYFVSLKKANDLKINLMVFDVETTQSSQLMAIERLLTEFTPLLLEKNGTIIFKTHVGLLLDTWNSGILTSLGPCFGSVQLISTSLSSSHTSEVYILLRHPSVRNVNCYPDLVAVLGELRQIPAFQTPEKEFKRALEVPTERMFEGVPRELHSDPQIELGLLLLHVGVETGVGALVGESIRQATGPKRGVMPYYILLAAMNSVFELTRGSNAQCIPSDQSIYKWGAFLTGFLYWLSWSRRRFAIFRNAQNYVSNMFYFSCRGVRGQKGLEFREISFLGRFQSEKNVYLDSQMALIGSTIRVLTRLFPRDFKVRFDRDLIDDLLRLDNRDYDLKKIADSSDLLEVLQPKTLNLPGRTPYVSAYVTNRAEAAWTSDRID